MFVRLVGWRLTLLDPEGLVTALVVFIADFFARLERHQHELQVFGGKANMSKIVFFLCNFLDFTK
jgi:hypothetical protein